MLQASEPRRQELIRRINLATGNTVKLVADARGSSGLLPETARSLLEVDDDFAHLFGSWFNRGFLVIRRIDWSTSAAILERIIRYEAVHAISGWDDLRRRIEPIDRRCYAFFHPALVDEPLIFVEVALTREIPDAIAPLLASSRSGAAGRADDGRLLLDQQHPGRSQGRLLWQFPDQARRLGAEARPARAHHLRHPVAGTRLRRLASASGEKPDDEGEADRATLALLDDPGWASDPAKAARLARPMPVAAYYFLQAKNGRAARRSGRPLPPRQRRPPGAPELAGRHLAKAMRESHGLMVNYLYALDRVEQYHEAYSNDAVVSASSAVKALLEPPEPAPSRRRDRR